MDISSTLLALRKRLPLHAAVIESLAGLVHRDQRLRSLQYGCSLGAGGGDEHSDVDAAIGYLEVSNEMLFDVAQTVVQQAAKVVDLVVHRMDGWPHDTCRVAAEYSNGVQLDLVLTPARNFPGLPDRSVAVVDKDGDLAQPWTPPSRAAPSAETAREWVVLAWWALSNVRKYLVRGSLYEAVEALEHAREIVLRVVAAGGAVPYAQFGLTSLLDFPPYRIPQRLSDTYALPLDQAQIANAARALASMLDDAVGEATALLGVDLHSPLASVVNERLARL